MGLPVRCDRQALSATAGGGRQNPVRIEEVVLLINELRKQMKARFAAMEATIDARFAQVRETMAKDMQVLLAAMEARKIAA
jgi:hypothetical protein